ncbi:MAG TPA: class I SAM-dependent methyltransferase [Opitutaceae bacterium]|nr:class I SAM-dependent methyltransferase [Opitutaceae bacterium]
MTATPSAKAFDFGENWSEFSDRALTPERVAQARTDFARLLQDVPLRSQAFLDIGFGQGLSLLAASSLGAATHGCDLNPKCVDVLQRNRRHFPDVPALPAVTVGSILDEQVVSQLRAIGPREGFAVVHSWGVLHHTGDLARAIRHAAGLVAPNGHLVLALYNRHWSSPAWRVIKWTYVHSAHWVQRALVGLLYPVIYLAKWAVTGRNPKRQERGMDFYYDVVDWVGGYPYEYASRDEIVQMLERQGFQLVKLLPARVPTGCNEFIFRRNAASAE